MESKANRTQEEIVARIQARKEGDMFGFEWQEYPLYLEFEHAKQFLKDDADGEEWDEGVREVDSPRERMVDYMEFAWGKANDERGISAGRSIAHFVAWLWLDGDNDLWPTISNYSNYGIPQLVDICEYLGLDHTKYKDC